MKLIKSPTKVAALLQAYVADNDDQSPRADDILALVAELLVYNHKGPRKFSTGTTPFKF